MKHELVDWLCIGLISMCLCVWTLADAKYDQETLAIIWSSWKGWENLMLMPFDGH